MTTARREPVEAWWFAVTALVVAVATGALLVTLAVLGARVSQNGFLGRAAVTAPSDSVIAALQAEAARNPLAPPGPAPPGVAPTGAELALVLGAFVGGPLLATAVAFGLLGRLNNSYRRTGIALTAGLGTVLPMLAANLVDTFFQQAGLLVLAAAMAVAIAVFGSRLSRMEPTT